MGIIRKQSIQYTIISYAGFAIGALNMLLLFPNYLTSAQIGLISVFSALAMPLAAVSNFGSIFTINRFLPYYRTYEGPGKSDLPVLTTGISLAGFSLVMSMVWIFKDEVMKWFDKSPLLVAYFDLLPFFTLGYLLCSILQAFNNGYMHTVWVGTVTEVIYRIFNLILIIGIIAGLYAFDLMFYFYIFIFWIGALLFYIKLRKERQFYFNFKVSALSRRMGRMIVKYAGFFWGATLFSVLATFIDTIVLAGIQGLEKSGLLMIATYFVTLTIVPQRSIVSVSVPVIAESWRRQDMANISLVYKKSANNMLWAGGLIFLLIMANINYLLSYLPEEYHEIKWVVFILGIAKMFDYATGVNQNIIALSRKNWKMDFYSNVLLVLMLIPLNYYLISNFSILGAALANLTAYFVYNSVKSVYLWKVFKLSPFDRQNIILIGWMFILLTLVFWEVSQSEVNTYGFWENGIHIFFRSFLMLVIYTGGMLIFSASDDFRSLVMQGLLRIKKIYNV